MPEYRVRGGSTVSGDPTATTSAARASATPAGGAVLRPTDLASVRAAVLDTAGPLAVVGAGTAASWGGTLGDVDTVLDTTALSGVITHNPGDMTVAVRAGTPLCELAAQLAPHRQHVALDAARIARGATVGGLVATGDAGPSALLHGSLRDLVIGATVVLADGTVARSGGHVIKNVAGYDLAKLLHGSYGTLAVLVEVVLRLHPVPRSTATVALDCPLDEAAEHAAHVLASPLEPIALEWCSGGAEAVGAADGTGAGGAPGGVDEGANDGGADAGPRGAARSGRLLVRLAGTEDALPARAGRLRELLGAAATDGGDQEWARHAALVTGGAQHAVLRIGAKPALLPALLASLPAATVTAGLGTGVATVALPADPEAVAAAHAAVHDAGGTSALRYRPAGLDAPAWGPPPPAVAVLRAVKHAFDPAARLGPGRFAAWLATS